MPVRNAGDFLHGAVESILDQTHTNLEVIIVDDHSTDHALTNLPRDSRLKLIKNNGYGLVDALNTGLNNASHEFIARMDADDLAHPRRITKQVDHLLQNPNLSICGCGVEIIADCGVAKGYKLYEAWINELTEHADIERELFIESPIAHPSAMFYKSEMLSLGGYQDHAWPEDYDLWCRALLNGYKFGKPKGPPLLQWRDHGMRTSRLDTRYSKSSFIACKANTLSRYLRSKSISKARIWGAGPTGLKLHDELVKRKFEINGFIDINPKLQGRQKRNKPVYIVTPSLNQSTGSPINTSNPDEIILVAVSARGARNKIRAFLDKQGWHEGLDYLCAA